MKIIVLDSYTLNPGDLSWDPLLEVGETIIYDRSSPNETILRSKEASILLTNKTVINAELIHSLPTLKYIGVLATGFNIVDIQAAREKSIVVTNVPSYGTSFVAQHTFALILELCNRVGIHDESVRQNEWTGSSDFSYWKSPLIELSGKTLGIIGLGKIGASVARIAQSFGMKIIASHKHSDNVRFPDIRFVSQDELCVTSDFVSLHCPLNADNKEFINKAFIYKMKRSAFLINTSRGALINEKDLADALNKDVIAGAALDVLSSEPPSTQNPLLNIPNCIITPHIAWAAKESRQRLLNIAVENIKAYLNDHPQNVII